ncbi:MAG: DNA methyltransferase [Promethearchaeota archaeon]
MSKFEYKFFNSYLPFIGRFSIEATMPVPDANHEFFICDNLKVLKGLLPTYSNRVALIFVDPPYNSPKDFIINDFPRMKRSYWISGTTQGNWLSMIYARLLLARQFLHPDYGLIVYTIDEKEYSQSKLILDEVMGEKNYIGTFIWRSMEGLKPNSIFTYNHTYIIIYARNIDYFLQSPAHLARFRVPLSNEGFTNLDNDPKGEWILKSIQTARKNLNNVYSVKISEVSSEIYPDHGKSWQISKDRMIT